VTRGELRIARSKIHLDSLRAEIEAWFNERDAEPRYARFARHFKVLREFLNKLLSAIDERLKLLAKQPPPCSGDAYDRCRATEQSLTVVRRTFEWYADKYDQRTTGTDGLPGSPLYATLLAADEVVRSCWTEPFVALGLAPPSGPLAYLDPRFDAFATPRESPPPDLRAPGDELIGEIVAALPIPTIALPISCPLEPWWLVLIAHETGHHVQKELVAQLENATRDALGVAVSKPPEGDPQLVADWRRWAVECFADAFSVLMVGAAAGWAVDELQHSTVERLVRAPTNTDRYPPPIVRLALLGELTATLEVPPHTFGMEEALAWLRGLTPDAATAAGRDAAERHLAVTPLVARALIDMPIALGRNLRQVCAWNPEYFAQKGSMMKWAAQLPSPTPVMTQLNRRWSARVAVSSGVRAYRDAQKVPPPDTTSQVRLRDNLISTLRTCGEPGTLAGAAAAPDVDELAARFAELLPDAATQRT
jgi:hypothetical protein